MELISFKFSTMGNFDYKFKIAICESIQFRRLSSFYSRQHGIKQNSRNSNREAVKHLFLLFKGCSGLMQTVDANLYHILCSVPGSEAPSPDLIQTKYYFSQASFPTVLFMFITLCSACKFLSSNWLAATRIHF